MQFETQQSIQPQPESIEQDCDPRTTTTTDPEQEWAKICAEHGIEENGIDASTNRDEDSTVRIYACATMWHEDRDEMLQMLKAVMRLDFDQGTRRIAKENWIGEGDQSQYYELEGEKMFRLIFRIDLHDI